MTDPGDGGNRLVGMRIGDPQLGIELGLDFWDSELVADVIWQYRSVIANAAVELREARAARLKAKRIEEAKKLLREEGILKE